MLLGQFSAKNLAGGGICTATKEVTALFRSPPYNKVKEARAVQKQNRSACVPEALRRSKPVPEHFPVPTQNEV